MNSDNKEENKKLTEEELKSTYCYRCIHSDQYCHCITKEQAPFNSFVCDNGEMFEEND